MSNNFLGRNVVVEYSPTGDGSTDPTGISDWTAFGMTTSKSLDPSTQTVENTNDDSAGVTSNLVTRLDLTISVDYYLDEDPATAHNTVFIDSLNATVDGDQPTYWLRMRGDKYPYVAYAFCIATPGSNDNGTDDVSSGTFDFKITDTDYGSSINPFQIVARS